MVWNGTTCISTSPSNVKVAAWINIKPVCLPNEHFLSQGTSLSSSKINCHFLCIRMALYYILYGYCTKLNKSVTFLEHNLMFQISKNEQM